MILSTNQTLFKMVYSKFGSTHFDIYIHVMLTSAAIQRWAWVNFVFGIIWFSIRAMQWFKKVSCTIFSYNFFFFVHLNNLCHDLNCRYSLWRRSKHFAFFLLLSLTLFLFLFFGVRSCDFVWMFAVIIIFILFFSWHVFYIFF